MASSEGRARKALAAPSATRCLSLRPLSSTRASTSLGRGKPKPCLSAVVAVPTSSSASSNAIVGRSFTPNASSRIAGM